MTNYLSTSDACRHAWIKYKQLNAAEATQEEIAFIAGYNAAIHQMYLVLDLADSGQENKKDELVPVA